MGQYAISFSICLILAKKYPEGVSLDELFTLAQEDDPERFTSEFWLHQALGIFNGKKISRGLVLCYRIEGDNYYYDATQPEYSTFDRNGDFGTNFSRYLIREGLEHLILAPYRDLQATKLTHCQKGIHFGHIPDPSQCNWDNQLGNCSLRCGIGRKEFIEWFSGKSEIDLSKYNV